MNKYLSTMQLVLLFVLLAFLIMYLDYFLIRPYAVDYYSDYIIKVDFQKFFITIYLKSLVIIFIGSIFLFFIVLFLLNLYNYSKISKVLIFNIILTSKFTYLLIWFIKFIYFKFVYQSYSMSQVINFTRFTVADLLGLNDIFIIKGPTISDMLFLIIFSSLIRYYLDNKSFLLAIFSYLIYYAIYLFYSFVIPGGLI